jgi:hypothetical protein
VAGIDTRAKIVRVLFSILERRVPSLLGASGMRSIDSHNADCEDFVEASGSEHLDPVVSPQQKRKSLVFRRIDVGGRTPPPSRTDQTCQINPPLGSVFISHLTRLLVPRTGLGVDLPSRRYTSSSPNAAGSRRRVVKADQLPFGNERAMGSSMSASIPAKPVHGHFSFGIHFSGCARSPPSRS